MSAQQYTGKVEVTAADGGDGVAHAIEERGFLPGFVHVDHRELASDKQNLMHASRSSPAARGTLDRLTQLGYYLYLAADGESRLVHHERVPMLWQRVVDGTYQLTESGVVHTFVPSADGPTTSLAVVLSPMAADVFETSINRYFQQSYLSLGKFLPPGTGVLRIGDLGGVKGAFYLNTTHRPDNAERISDFLQEFVEQQGIPRERVVLYGASKGGTGGLYHSLKTGWHVVSVDPIIADEFYESKYNDLHFTSGGIFPVTKEEAFADAIAHSSTVGFGPWQRVIVTSSRSPQKSYIDSGLAPILESLTIFDSSNPKIVSHPTVARNTLWAHLMILNNVLTGFEYPTGLRPIP